MGERKMSRNAFNDCEREYNRKEEAIEMARKDQLDEQGRLNAMGQEREARLMAELAEVKRESLKLSALVVERDYQITLANKGYDYEGAVEDARHYKEMAEKYKAELAAYKLWAEVEIADLRDDVKRLLGELFTTRGNAT